MNYFERWQENLRLENYYQQEQDDDDEGRGPPRHTNYFVDFFFRLLRLFAFQIYLAFWIPKQLCFLVIKCVKILMFYILVKPLLFICAMFSNNVQFNFSWRSSVLSFILAISLLSLYVIAKFNDHQSQISFMKNLSKVVTISAEALMFSSTINNNNNDDNDNNSDDDNNNIWDGFLKGAEVINLNSLKKIMDIITSLNDSNTEAQDKLIEEAKNNKAKIDALQSELEAEVKNIWSRIAEQQSQIEHTEKELYLDLDKRQSEFEDNYQNQIGMIVKTLRQDIDDAIQKWRSSEVIAARLFPEEDGEPPKEFTTQAFFELLTNNLYAEDQIDTSLEAIINKYIQSYHQDVLNSADFALGHRGAQISHSKTSRTYYHLPAWKQAIRYILGASPATTTHIPEMAISPETYAGECWSMYGSEGNLGIILSEPIRIQGITVEYPSEEIMFDSIKNAPKEMEIYGIPYSSKKNSKEEVLLLGSIIYDIHQKEETTIQTFEINQAKFSDVIFYAVQIKILSNWGNPEYTDIYRIRIHGIPLKK